MGLGVWGSPTDFWEFLGVSFCLLGEYLDRCWVTPDLAATVMFTYALFCISENEIREFCEISEYNV